MKKEKLVEVSIRRLSRLGILLISLCGLVGCASTRQYVPFPNQNKRVENPDKGRIYVMRPAFVGASIPMDVLDNGKRIGTTGPKGYLCWEREEGNAKVIGETENTNILDLTVQKGMVYYIFQHVRVGWLIARNKLQLLTEEEGKKVLGKCKPPKIEASR